MEAKLKIDQGGRIIVPASFRKALGIENGDELVAYLEEGSIKLTPLQEAIRLAQQKVKKYSDGKLSLSESLIESRRIEVESE